MKVIDIFGHIHVCIQSCVLDLNEPFFVCTGPPFHMYTCKYLMTIGCLCDRNLLQVFHVNNTCTQRQKLIDRHLYGSAVLVYIFDHSIVPDNSSKQRSENIDKKQWFYISQIRFSDLIEFCYIKESIVKTVVIFSK